MQLEIFDISIPPRYELSYMICPIGRIKNWIKKEKKFTYDKVGPFKSVTYPAHISIGKTKKLHFENEIEEVLVNIEESLSTIRPFEIHFDGFEYFPGSNTIYVKIVNPENIIEIFNAIFIGNPPNPHMTIAENLTDEQFHIAWHHFQDKEFKDQFFCVDVLVLQKESKANHWQRYKQIPLGSATILR